EGAGREHAADALRIADDAPAEAPAVAGRETGDDVAGLDVGHLADAGGGDDALAVEFPAVEDGLIEAVEVVGSGEESAGRIRNSVGFAGVNPALAGLQVGFVRAF